MVDAVVSAGGVSSGSGRWIDRGACGMPVLLRKDVELASAVRDGALRTLPGVHGCDGFYAVVVERA